MEVLPQPDSPSNPTLSPRFKVKLTPSTALTVPPLPTIAESAPPTR